MAEKFLDTRPILTLLKIVGSKVWFMAEKEGEFLDTIPILTFLQLFFYPKYALWQRRNLALDVWCIGIL